MQFLVIAHDATDDKAHERRAAARQAHLVLSDHMKYVGTLLFAVAILDESEDMIGSVMVCDFDTREQFDQWLEKEPYVTGKVWEKIDVKTCRVGPNFTAMRPSM
jgi:uncharacterized protein YciI